MSDTDPNNTNLSHNVALDGDVVPDQQSAQQVPKAREEHSGARAQATKNSGAHEGEVPSSIDSSLTPKSRDQKSRARAQQPALESLGELLRALYGGKLKRRSLRKAEIAAMSTAKKLEASEREELLALVSLDRTLEKTRDLMLLSIENIDASALMVQFREFIGVALRHHPAFTSAPLNGVLENLAGSPSEERAVQALLSQDYTSLPWPEEIAPMKKKEAEQCKVNALRCLLLWFRETRGTSVERIQRHLQSNLWAPAARRYKAERQKLGALMNIRDTAAVAIACSMYESQALEQRQRADAARSAEERILARARELEGDLADTGAKLVVAQAEANRITKALLDARQTHQNERAHLQDDYEKLRGQVLHSLKKELLLLDEGLHALRRDPPKVHVMVDHAERAIDALKLEIVRLRGDT